MASTKRLTGRDGKLYVVSKSAEITGNGTTKLTKGEFYVPTQLASTSSGFQSGAQVGVPLIGDGTSAPTASEKYISLTLASQCDITSAGVEFEKDEIDITTLCDDIMKYAAGFTDATGTLEGITTLGKTEPFIAKFVTVQTQSSTGAITTTAQNNDTVLLAIELNKIDNTDANRALFIAPITINSYNLGATVNEAQTYTSNFRIAQDNEIKPALIEGDKALFSEST
ncbi:MAG: hypothetical protein II306_06520 [Clostridia bacterium]|nr:hypothetical protein [Clostridia bacterium]